MSLDFSKWLFPKPGPPPECVFPDPEHPSVAVVDGHVFDFGKNYIPRQGFAKFWIRAKEEPFAVTTLGLTVYVMYRALKARRRDSKAFNRWLWWRVGMQGLTVVLLLAGEVYYRPFRAAEAYGYQQYLDIQARETLRRTLESSEYVEDPQFILRKRDLKEGDEERRKTPAELREIEDRKREEGINSEFMRNYRERRRAQLVEQKMKEEGTWKENGTEKEGQEEKKEGSVGRSWWNVGGIFGR